jgi:hypothetical protein
MKAQQEWMRNDDGLKASLHRRGAPGDNVHRLEGEEEE